VSRFRFDPPKALKLPLDVFNWENFAGIAPAAGYGVIRLALVVAAKGNLPDDDAKLAALSALGPALWAEHGAAVRACLEPDLGDPGRLVVSFALEDRERYEEWCAKSSRGGKSKGGSRVVEGSSEQSSSHPSFPPSGLPSGLPEECMRSEPQERQSDPPPSPLPRVEVDDLKDDGRFLALLARLRPKNMGDLELACLARARVLHLQARSPGEVQNPGAYFMKLLKDPDYEGFSAAEKEAAEKALQAIRRRADR
jgi:hypothetical protein